MSKLEEASRILVALGMPRPQTNDNACYTLIAFASVAPRTPWAKARRPSLTVNGVIDFVHEQHGKTYATGSRESIRRGDRASRQQPGSADRPLFLYPSHSSRLIAFSMPTSSASSRLPWTCSNAARRGSRPDTNSPRYRGAAVLIFS